MHEKKQTILVPVFGGDITEDALTTARSLVAGDDTRLVLVHVAPAADTAGRGFAVTEAPATDRRWQRLASVAPHRTFVEAVAGDPTDLVLSEAERFHCKTIVLGKPVRLGDRANWIDHCISEIVRAAPARVRVVANRHRRRPPTARARTRVRRTASTHSETPC